MTYAPSVLSKHGKRDDTNYVTGYHIYTAPYNSYNNRLEGELRRFKSP